VKKATKKKTEKEKMGDIDDEIAKLEAALKAIESESDSSDDEADSKLKSDNADDFIPPLPKEYLPKISRGTKVNVEKKKKAKRKHDDVRPPEDISKKSKQMELMDYINGYRPSERLPFYCRVCQVQVCRHCVNMVM
jgi:hypothetical protein